MPWHDDNRRRTNLGEKIVTVIGVLFFALLFIFLFFAYNAMF